MKHRAQEDTGRRTGADHELPPEERADYRLLRRFADGDEAAFEQMHGKYASKLLQYVYR